MSFVFGDGVRVADPVVVYWRTADIRLVPNALSRRQLGALRCGYDDPDGASIIDPDGVGPAIGFLRVPKGKIGELGSSRRFHLDVTPTDGTRDDEVSRLMGVGAPEYEDRRKPDSTGG